MYIKDVRVLFRVFIYETKLFCGRVKHAKINLNRNHIKTWE